MSAEDKDTEEVEEATQEDDKRKRRRLRGRSKPAEEATTEEKPASEEEAASEEKAASEKKPKRRRAAKAKTAPQSEAAQEPAAEAKADADAEPQSPEEAPEAEEVTSPDAATTPPEETADEPPAQARPAPRRRAPQPDGAPAFVRARARYVRTSARKARLVSDHIRGKSVEEARAILAFAPRAVARDWSKLLESAVANAEHNHELVGDDLRIKDVYADEGPTLKRYRPRAMGRATRIRKRTSHLTITLTPKENR